MMKFTDAELSVIKGLLTGAMIQHNSKIEWQRQMIEGRDKIEQ